MSTNVCAWQNLFREWIANHRSACPHGITKHTNTWCPVALYHYGAVNTVPSAKCHVLPSVF